MEVRIQFFRVTGKRKTNNGNGNWNSVFQYRRKTENESGSSNSVYRGRGKTETKKRKFELPLEYNHLIRSLGTSVELMTRLCTVKFEAQT